MTSDLATFPIIDSHQHLWNLDAIQLPWLNDPAYKPIARNFTPDDYAAATDGFNVLQTVYLEVDARPADHAAEVAFITELAKRPANRIGGAVVGCRPATTEFKSWVNKLASNPLIKGAREVLFDRPTRHCLEPQYLDSVRALAAHALLFEIEAPAEQLSIVLELVEHCPDTQFVLDHCGHPQLGQRDSNWEQGVAKLASRSNVVAKVSGLFSGAPVESCTPSAIEPALRHLLEVFGPDRVLFGSDWPVVTLSSTFAAWTESVWQVINYLAPSAKQRLFHENARRIYQLPGN